MSVNDFRNDTPRPALATVLHNANLRTALVALALASISIVIVGLVSLRIYMIDNLGLSARNIAYTVEAAVVFNDREAANETLRQMAGNPLVASAYVIDRDGDEISRWEGSAKNIWSGPEHLLANLLLAQPAIATIDHSGQQVGIVKLYGSGRNLLLFMLVCFGCGICCLALCAFVASKLSRRSSLAIVEPLQHLAEIAAKARSERQFKYQVQPMAIAELQSLGDDFNALLKELESWREQMLDHNEQLNFKANHDPLTGLANRAHFEARLAQALKTAHEKSERIALFFIDADRFKSINDELGHEVGDAVLCAIARRLRSRVREGDLVARLGGDEFAVLLTPLGSPLQAGRIAGNILDSMVEPIELPSGSTLHTSLSVGVALYPDHATDATGLLKKADTAMYESKHAGRGVYSLAKNSGSEQPGETRD